MDSNKLTVSVPYAFFLGEVGCIRYPHMSNPTVCNFRPCVMYRNPLIHSTIKVLNGISLDANEVLVVYRHDEETKKVERYLQHGPTLFIPDANEW